MTLEDLPETMKQHLAKKTVRDKTYADHRFGVTELLGCDRKLWFRRRLPKPISLNMMYIFNRGMLWDTEYTEIYERNQVRVTHRVPNSPVVISGRLDFIDDDGAVTDLKTTENLYFIRKNGAKPDNVSQVLFYCWCEGIDKARLIYMTLSDAETVDVDATYERQVENLERLEKRALASYDNLQHDAPPMMDDLHAPDYWECCYKKAGREVKCEYFSECHGG